MLQYFKEFDIDGDGELSKDELRKGIKKCMALDDCHEDDLTILMERMDKDGNGTVSYAEFVKEAEGFCMLFSENRMRHAFSLFDMDEDGTINLIEV